jgi:hypothetical protein
MSQKESRPKAAINRFNGFDTNRTHGRFNKQRLPSPGDYYRALGLKLTGGGEWRSTQCLIHDDDRPSLRVRVDTGAFRCMACDARGGDVLAFHRLLHGLDFVAAAKDLGAWEWPQ